MNKTNCSLTLILLVVAFNLYAGGKRPVVEKPSSWIVPTAVDYNGNRYDDEAEDGYTDLHYEKQVSLQQQAIFYKKAVHIISEAGVQNRSQVSVDYDPSYQSLAFHTIRIVRGTESINKLDASKIKTIQQEKELNRFLYNGSLTAVLFLEDVRKGDVIEYSYTVKGFNPIFKNKYADMFQTTYGVPVYKLYYRVLVPKERVLNIKSVSTGIQPIISTAATEKVYEWTIAGSGSVKTESNVPSWYDAYPMVTVSEFGSWKEVAGWAQELFPFNTPLQPALQQKIAEIKAANQSKESQLLAALRFVQDDVRYMGIEMGVSSHKPHSPSQVLTQRFGDCKDKAYLLCTLFRALGIEAYPVLNNTFYKKTIAAWQPLPTAFDHATVCAQVNGKTSWFDPTISYQRGPLDAVSYPDYQTGLVVRPDATGLTTIPLQNAGNVNVKETFAVESLHRSVKLKVTTQYSGSFADNTRYLFQTSSLSEIKKTYKEFYGAYFKKLEADSVTYNDNERSGLFTTVEYYALRDFWKEEGQKTNVFVEPYVINSIVKKPKGESRSMPYSLAYPATYHEEIEVQLPEEWPVQEAESNVRNEAFVFSSRFTRTAGNTVLIAYDYQNLSDHVAANSTADYLKKMANAEEHMAFELYSDRSGSTASASSLSASSKGFATAYVLLGICALATYVYRKKNQQKNNW